MSILPDESINRILGWIERGVKTAADRQEQERLYNILFNEYTTAAEKGFSWLSLWLLTTAIGLDPRQAEHLAATKKLLLKLPPPRGPARPSRTRPGADEKEYDQKWGLVSDPRVGP